MIFLLRRNPCGQTCEMAARHASKWGHYFRSVQEYVGVSENSVPLNPMVNDHLSLLNGYFIGNIPYQTNPCVLSEPLSGGGGSSPTDGAAKVSPCPTPPPRLRTPDDSGLALPKQLSFDGPPGAGVWGMLQCW